MVRGRGGTAIELVAFDHELRRLTAADPLARPFVCDGSPLDCQVFIVGANPATAVPFWPYWDATIGFDRRRWQADYEASRIASGKRPRSNTRERIERFVAGAAPVRILETNVFATPSPSVERLDARSRSIAVLRYLVDTIRPAVILAHGHDAMRAVPLLRTPNAGFEVVETEHFRIISYDRASTLGRQLRDTATSHGRVEAINSGS